MAEELRYFVRTAVWVAIAGGVYWVVTRDPPGTVLLLFLLVALMAVVAIAGAFAPEAFAQVRGGGMLGLLDRIIGFHERTEGLPPLHGEPEIVPLESSWPIVTAAAFVVIGLGLVLGPWLLLPGIALLAIGGVGWLTQLDR